MNNSDSDASTKTTIDTLANLATKYSKLHRNYNALCLQKKELIAKIKSVIISMKFRILCSQVSKSVDSCFSRSV